MTKQETGKIIALLEAYYELKKDPKTTVNAYHLVLQGYDYIVVEQAVINLAREDRREYSQFPSVGAIVSQIELISGKDDTAAELWTLVEKASRNGYYGCVEEFNKLPEVCQKWLGSPSALRELSLSDMNILQTVTRGQFLKTIEVIKKREKAKKALPEDIRKLIQNANLQLESGGTL